MRNIPFYILIAKMHQPISLACDAVGGSLAFAMASLSKVCGRCRKRKTGKVFLDVQFVPYRESIGLGPNLHLTWPLILRLGRDPCLHFVRRHSKKRTEWFGKVYGVASKKW